MMLGRLIALGLAVLGALSCPAIAQRTLSGAEVLRGEFEQERFLVGFDSPLRSKGRFTLDMRHGLLWQIEAPFAVTTALSAGGIVQEVRGAETMRLTADRIPFLANLYAVLSGALGGDVTGLARMFRLARADDGGHWRLTLTPNASQMASLPIDEIIIAGNSLVEDVQIRRRNGDRDHVRFHSQEVSERALMPGELQLLRPLQRP